MPSHFIVPAPIIMVASLAFAGLAIFRPFKAFLVLVFFLPWESTLYAGANSFTLTKLFGLLLFPAWLTNNVLKGGNFRVSKFILVMLFLGVWFSISSYFTSFDAFGETNTFFQNLVLVIIATNLITSNSRVKYVLIAVTLSVALSSVYSAFFPSADAVRVDRFALGISDQNLSSFILGCALVASIALLTSFKTKGIIKGMILICCVFLMIGVVMTGSRGGFLAAMSAGTVFLWYSGLGQKLKVALVTMLLALVCFSMFGPKAKVDLPDQFRQFEKAVDRIQNFVLGKDEGRDSPRTKIWEHGFILVKEKPLLGHGYDSFAPIVGMDPHNDLLRITAEAGLIGLLLYSLLFIGSALEIFKFKTKQERGWRFALLCLCLISIIFVGLFDAKFFWVALCVCWCGFESTDIRNLDIRQRLSAKKYIEH